jgi:hypothetical protein
MLSYIDPAAIAATAAVPAELADRILGDLHRGGALQRRKRRTTVAALIGAGLIAASFILASLFSGSSAPKAPTQRTMALSGLSSVSATAVLSQKPWGTSLALKEEGLPGGTVYTVSMRTAKGTWWVAGTYRSNSSGPVNATMACAVALNEIDGLRVTNSSGAIVLSSYGDGDSAG